jgi:hypothetical protein
MKTILSLAIAMGFVASNSLAAPPKDKEVPPGHARKAAAAAAATGSTATVRSTATRDYTAPSRATSTRQYSTPTVRSTVTRSSTGSYDGDRRYTTSTRDTDRSYSTYRDGDRYRSSSRYDSGDRYRSGYRYSRPSIDIYRNWDRGRVYSWNNNRYHWYGGSWVIYDASPRVVYTEREIGGSVVASVQAELRRRGYDAGPADGVMGGRTRSAILDFQADHGLSRTGRINESLLRALDLA